MSRKFFQNFEYFRQNSHILLLRIVPILWQELAEFGLNFERSLFSSKISCVFDTHSEMSRKFFQNFEYLRQHSHILPLSSLFWTYMYDIAICMELKQTTLNQTKLVYLSNIIKITSKSTSLYVA